MNIVIVGLGDYSRNVYAQGDDGIMQSVRLVADKVRESYLRAINDPKAQLRGWLGKVLIKAGKPRRVKDVTTAILGAVRHQTMYLSDPIGVEFVPTPEAMLCLNPDVCTPADDCDGLTALCATLTLLAGIPTRLVKQKFVGIGMQHILSAVEDEQGEWLGMDASMTNKPVGWRPQADDELWIDPLEDVAPQIVGVGAVPAPAHGVYQHDAAGKMWRYVGGDQWRAVSLGAVISLAVATDAYAAAANDLGNQVQAPISAGDQYLTAGEYTSAVQAYQGAGMAGATSVGPEIDLAGAPNATQGFTQAAWTMNAQLAAIIASSADEAVASQAQQLAKSMLDQYTSAISAGRGALAATAGGGTPESTGGVGAPAAVGFALALAALVGLGVGVHRRQKKLDRKRR